MDFLEIKDNINKYRIAEDKESLLQSIQKKDSKANSKLVAFFVSIFFMLSYFLVYKSYQIILIDSKTFFHVYTMFYFSIVPFACFIRFYFSCFENNALNNIEKIKFFITASIANCLYLFFAVNIINLINSSYVTFVENTYYFNVFILSSFLIIFIYYFRDIFNKHNLSHHTSIKNEIIQNIENKTAMKENIVSFIRTFEEFEYISLLVKKYKITSLDKDIKNKGLNVIKKEGFNSFSEYREHKIINSVFKETAIINS